MAPRTRSGIRQIINDHIYLYYRYRRTDRTPFIGPPRVRARGWCALSIAPDRRFA
jgi:hypothetical protein